MSRYAVPPLSGIKKNANRRQTEKLTRDHDNLTPLDARNSLLLLPPEEQRKYHARDGSNGTQSTEPFGPYYDDPSYKGAGGYTDNISLSERPVRNERTDSPSPSMRLPLLPQIDMSYQSRGY